jgi:hypothetical protein
VSSSRGKGSAGEYPQEGKDVPQIGQNGCVDQLESAVYKVRVSPSEGFNDSAGDFAVDSTHGIAVSSRSLRTTKETAERWALTS